MSEPLFIKVLTLILLLTLAYPTHSSIYGYLLNDRNIDFYFIIYGSSGCPHCINMKNFLMNSYGSNRVLFIDINSDREAYERFMILVKHGVSGYVPLTFVIYNDNITCAIQGEFTNKAVIDRILKPNDKNEFIIYTSSINNLVPSKTVYFGEGYTHRDFIDFLNGYSQRINIEIREITDNVEKENIFLTIIPAMIILALVDSINPCTFALYVSFTLSCTYSRKISRGPPLLFINMVYLGYLLFGLGLSIIAYMLGKFRIIFFIAALLLGVINIFSAGRLGLYSFKCKWCEKIHINPVVFRNKYLLAVFLSLFSIVFLLPCTSGPLMIFAVMISGYDLFIRTLLLGIYNIIFVLPLIAIYLIIANTAKVNKVAKWIEANSGILEFLTGIILVIIAIIFIGTSI
uniref:Cytochrome c biogenesis protein, transmembrane region n=1 Tax=Staphylothermus marinus TaxID=2280 RepID=A0A7C4D989_STAMA